MDTKLGSITWESAPDETSTFNTWEKARPVILLEWPFSLLFTCIKKMVSIYQASQLMSSGDKYPWSTSYLINTNIVYLNCGIIHANSNNIVILRMKSKKCCCRWWWHESCHCLHLPTRNWDWLYENNMIENLTILYPCHTLKVIILKREIFPPDADITYESFLDRAKQGTASSGFVSATSLVIRMPLVGCHNWGKTLAVAWRMKQKIFFYLKFLNLMSKRTCAWSNLLAPAYLASRITVTPLPFP